MTSEGAYRQEGLRPNDLVEKVMPDPSQPAPPMVVFQGLLGKSVREGYSRLYFTSALDYYIEFRKVDEEYSESIPKEQSGLGFDSTKVWIKQDATIELTFRTGSSQASMLFEQGLLDTGGPGPELSDILAILLGARGGRHR